MDGTQLKSASYPSLLTANAHSTTANNKQWGEITVAFRTVSVC